jgi:hypothetical protein
MTFKQATAKSEEHYPISDTYGFPLTHNRQKREIYMKCWEDMKDLPTLKYIHAPGHNQNGDNSL